ncbi:MAG TPA: hypothetical protein PLY93_05925 [Turneriella sp.]|nr:hypothetical protein [Turneriella sp.]
MSSSVLSRVKPRPEGGFTHNWNDTILTNLGATADHFLRTFLSTRMMFANIGTIPNVFQKEQRAKWDFYRNPEFIRRPETFFKHPEKTTPIVRGADPMGLGMDEAIYEDIIFPSSMSPLNPSYDKEEIFSTPQASSIARHIRHKTNSNERPTLIVVHGYVLDGYDFNAFLFEIERFFRLGFNILMYTMPFHGPRQKKNAAFSGDGFMVFDAGRIAETIRWSIHDLTRYIDFITAHSKAPIGMMGFSLGGFHTALMASLDARLHFAIPVVPVITLFDVILDWQPSAAVIQAFLPLLNLSRESLNETLAVISPLSRPPLVPHERRFIIAGTADRMAHPKHAQSLWKHWDEPRMYWFPGNHLVHFEKERFMREVAVFMRGMRLF